MILRFGWSVAYCHVRGSGNRGHQVGDKYLLVLCEMNVLNTFIFGTLLCFVVVVVVVVVL
jgi:hypothetical protein